ncbi:hypothetical protein ILYODFUR_038449 [Ilyodon furcidens]|uniref:Uncharacterized protein n=1 Tax=Ilyodon furcidens TaxID=33524 RepID=A0ABV0UYP2_9TELE
MGSTSSYGKNDNMTKGCGGEWRVGRSSTVTQIYSVIKPPPTLEQTKSYKTFGGKLASSEVEDKENGEFHHEVILTVQSHALRCSIPRKTHTKLGEQRPLDLNTAHQSFNNKVTCMYHSEHIQNTLTALTALKISSTLPGYS